MFVCCFSLSFAYSSTKIRDELTLMHSAKDEKEKEEHLDKLLSDGIIHSSTKTYIMQNEKILYQ